VGSKFCLPGNPEIAFFWIFRQPLPKTRSPFMLITYIENFSKNQKRSGLVENVMNSML